MLDSFHLDQIGSLMNHPGEGKRPLHMGKGGSLGRQWSRVAIIQICMEFALVLLPTVLQWGALTPTNPVPTKL